MKNLFFLFFFLICGCSHITIPATNRETGEVKNIPLFRGEFIFVNSSQTKNYIEKTENIPKDIIQLPEITVSEDTVEQQTPFWSFVPIGFLSGDIETQEKIGRIVYSNQEEGEPNIFYLHFFYGEW